MNKGFLCLIKRAALCGLPCCFFPILVHAQCMLSGYFSRSGFERLGQGRTASVTSAAFLEVNHTVLHSGPEV